MTAKSAQQGHYVFFLPISTSDLRASVEANKPDNLQQKCSGANDYSYYR